MRLSALDALREKAGRIETVQPSEFLNEMGKKKPRVRSSSPPDTAPTLFDDIEKPGPPKELPYTSLHIAEWHDVGKNERRCRTSDDALELRAGRAKDNICWWGVVEVGDQTVRVMEKGYWSLEQMQAKSLHWWAWEWDGEPIEPLHAEENRLYLVDREKEREKLVSAIKSMDINGLLRTAIEWPADDIE